MIIRLIKQWKCDHNYITETNLHGDVINAYSTTKKTVRSIKRCVKCGKIVRSEILDPDCNTINFSIKRCANCSKGCE